MISNSLISRLAFSFPTLYPHFKFTVLQHNAFLFFFNSFTSQSNRRQKDNNFTVSYLTSSCGLSPEIAARLSKKLKLTTPDNPNSVLFLLKNYGLSQTQIAEYVRKEPLVLLVQAEKTLLPKLKFFQSIGVSVSDMPKFVVDHYGILRRSLDKCIIPRYKVLRSVACSDDEAVRTLKRRAFSFLLCDVARTLVPNMNALRECGVPQASISYLLIYHAGAAFAKHSKFLESVQIAKELGFDPSKISFVNAVNVLVALDREKLELRLGVFKKWGWSRQMSILAFRKYQTFMSYTEKRITKSMDFLVKDMGWSSEDIARFPATLAYKLEKRIMPRCQVIKILKSKGRVKDDLKLTSFVCITEEKFLETFVTKFLKDVPLLLDAYRGLIDHCNLL